MLKKSWGSLGIGGAASLAGLLLVLLLACPRLTSPEPDPPVSREGTFAVALATRAAAAGATAEFVADGAIGSQVQGVGVGLNAAKAAPAPDPAAWGRSALELWLTHSSYFNSDGSAKPRTSGGNDLYQLWWDAYDPAVSPPVSLAAAAPATDKVALTDSFAGSDKVARKKLQVGNTLLRHLGGEDDSQIGRAAFHGIITCPWTLGNCNIFRLEVLHCGLFLTKGDHARRS